MDISRNIRTIAKGIRRTFKLSPMHGIFRCLEGYGYDSEKLTTLELFGWNGDIHGRDVASIVSKMEIWEIEAKWELVLKKKFPKAEIKITDSYKEIKKKEKKFDVVIIDNPYEYDGRYEHFYLFPEIFHVLNDRGAIVLIVMPNIPLDASIEWLKQRETFYKTTDPKSITFDEFQRTYHQISLQNGWHVENVFFKRRWGGKREEKIWYLVLMLTKKTCMMQHEKQKKASVRK